MNAIVRPITEDGMCGYDEFNQLCLWEPTEDGGRRGYMIRDVRGKTCRICAHGWILAVASLRDQSYWHEYDELVHRSCLVRYGALRERDLWTGILYDLGILHRKIEEIPNRYWGRDEWYSKRPWYRVELMAIPADLELGHRKRVYSIRARSVGPEPLSGWERAKEAFKDQEVTKEFGAKEVLVHAWSDAAAKDYVRRLADTLGFAEKKGAPK